MADLASLQADLAYYQDVERRLIAGGGVTSVRDRDGRTVTYAPASLGAVQARLAWIARQIALLQSACGSHGPVLIQF